ncbi:MAG: M48 family metalloprotease [Deltaproteobacteria bacterium]|nr:M48 family metalloprotease [Deltaproteobacteria bacterium]
MLNTVLLYAVPAAIALFPGLFAWSSGKKLLGRLSQPDFAEALQQSQRRTSMVLLTVILVLVLVFKGGGLWLAIAFLANSLGGFSSRRKMFGETWSFWRYLFFSLRFWIGYLGIWMIIFLTPALLLNAGSAGWPLAGLLAALACLWYAFNPAIFPRLLGAKSLQRPDLEEPLANILRQASCKTPILYQAGPKGGHFINAFALPGLVGSQGVLFSDGLLEALGPRETTAIFAHEVAHLEHFTRRRLLRGMFALLVLMGAAALLTLEVGPRFLPEPVIIWGWFVIVLFSLTRSMARRKQHEGDSDLRALELCGDPQALIDGLSKIHVLLRQPRRQSARTEEGASHPSLAKRIQAIRAASGALPESTEALTLLGAGEPGRGAVLNADRIVWLSGLPEGATPDPERPLEAAKEARAQNYGELRELRLELKRGVTSLRSLDSQGRTDSMPLNPEDVASVQSHLDRIDHHLGAQLAASEKSRPAPQTRQARQVAVLGAVISLFPAVPWALLPAAILAALRPIQASLAAAGVCAAGGAIHLWLNPPSLGSFSDGMAPLILLLLALLGILFGYYATIAAPPQGKGKRWPMITAVTLLVVAALASLGAIAAVNGHLPRMNLHLWAREASTFVLSLLGAAVALWTVPRRSTRMLATLPLLLAAAAIYISTTPFRTTASEDALAIAPSPLPPREVVVELVREFEVEGFPSQLRLSPAGTTVAIGAIQNYDEYPYSDSAQATYRIILADGSSTNIDADSLEFVSESTVLLLRSDKEQLHLQTFPLAGEKSSPWQVRLRPLSRPQLQIDPDSQRWAVSGLKRDEKRFIRFSGEIGGLEVQETSWDLGTGGDDLLPDALHPGSHGTVLTSRMLYDSAATSAFFFLTMSGRVGFPSEISIFNTNGDPAKRLTALGLQCQMPTLAGDAFLCLASDKSSTALWSFPVDGSEPKGLGSLQGPNYQTSSSAAGRVLLYAAGTTYLFDLKSSELLQLDLGSEEEQPAESSAPGWLANMETYEFDFFNAVAVAKKHVAVADTDWDSGTTVSVFEILE